MYHTHFYFWSLGDGICSVFPSILENIYIAAIVTRLWLSNLWFRSWQGEEIFLFSKMSSLVTGPRQPPIQWVLVFFPGVKCLGCQVYHSSPSKVMNLCSWTSTTSPPICLHAVEWDSVLHLLDSVLLEYPTRFASPLFQTCSLCWIHPAWFTIKYDPGTLSLINLSSLLCKYICSNFFKIMFKPLSKILSGVFSLAV